MNKEQKAKIISEVKERFEKAKAVVMTDYKGLNVEEITELRAKLHETSCEYKVIKNTLTQLAISEMKLKGLEEFLTGPTAIAFEYGDPVASTKVISNFQKEHEKFKIKVGVLGKKILTRQDVKSLASLPDRETILSMLFARMQSPITGIVNVLQAPLRNLVNVLDAISKQKA